MTGMASITTASTPPEGATRPVALWLFVMCALVALMVTIGGATRLTESGLSITEWRPVTGVVPPLNAADWQAEFEKYKTIPQYAALNSGMTLAGFKQIYWWEWSHRLLGRAIGFAFLLPLIFFAATGRIRRQLAGRLVIIFLLGGAQGLLGWYMVKSGLSDRIEVSQYRLAAHLALAVLLYAAMFWIALDLMRPVETARPRPLFWGAAALAIGVYLQMILGAFVAGLRAGRSFNTWPLMDGRFVPPGYLHGPPGLRNFFENIAAVQFDHRIGAYLVAAGATWYFLAARGTAIAARARLVLIAVALQIGLGVWTLLAVTPVALGLLHQLGALAVLSAALYAAHGCWGGGMLIGKPVSSSS
ncbi:MAG TPA: COX15/CtaA family protein [Parvularculaceae bacterium]|nr:COX15/CtaA family protein [Parvularculaceae bacterium]